VRNAIGRGVTSQIVRQFSSGKSINVQAVAQKIFADELKKIAVANYSAQNTQRKLAMEFP